MFKNTLLYSVMVVICAWLLSCASTPPEAQEAEEVRKVAPEVKTDGSLDVIIYTGSKSIGPGLLSDAIADDDVIVTITNAIPNQEYSYMLGDASGSITSPDGTIILTKGQLYSTNASNGDALIMTTADSQETIAEYRSTEVWTWHDLQAIQHDLSADYVLMNNITFPDNNNDGIGDYSFRPIKGPNPARNSSDRFSGSIDGNGFTISKLYINRRNEDFVGLFGYVDAGASVKSLLISDASITASGKSNYVGAIAGHSKGSIGGSYTGNITGNTMVGGLVGVSENAEITGYASGDITGVSIVGGLVGRANAGKITGYSTGNIAAERNVVSDRFGGLVGESMHASVYGYSSANVSGFNTLGGLVGEFIPVRGGAPFQIVGFATGFLKGTHPSKVSASIGGLVSRSKSNLGNAVHGYWSRQGTGSDTSLGGEGISSITNVVYDSAKNEYRDRTSAKQVFNDPVFIEHMELPGESALWPKLKDFPYAQPELR